MSEAGREGGRVGRGGMEEEGGWGKSGRGEGGMEEEGGWGKSGRGGREGGREGEVKREGGEGGRWIGRVGSREGRRRGVTFDICCVPTCMLLERRPPLLGSDPVDLGDAAIAFQVLSTALPTGLLSP